MGEYGRQQRYQLSRVIADNRCGNRQLKGFVDNKRGSSLIQMIRVARTAARPNIDALADARRNIFPSLGTSTHNFAVGKGYPNSWASSNAEGHSEARTAAMTLGILAGRRSIEILSEREPCDSCRNDMEKIEDATDDNVDVTVRYLVNNDINAPENLRAIYQ